MDFTKLIENKNGHLFFAGRSVEELAKKYDTPFYLYDEEKIRANYRKLNSTFKKFYPKFKLYYAVKCNNNLSVLNILRQEGSGADCSSPSELKFAELAGFDQNKLLYSGNNHRDEELKYALDEGSRINLDDIEQIDRIAKIKIPEFICFRVNPGVGKGKFAGIVTAGPDAKFGIIPSQVLDAYKKAKSLGVKKFGMHMMTGSCVLDNDYFPAVVEKLMDIAGEVTKKLGIKFEFIDIGGGLGIPYKEDENELNIELVAKKVTDVFKKKLKEYKMGNPFLVMEPGRFFVGNAGVLVARVHSIKNGYKKFIGIDAGMNTLLRPAIYGAYHHMFVANKLNEKKKEKVNICGQICENSDIFAKDRELPIISRGDLIVIMNAGAYGYGMSSQYNSRPRAAEILVNNKKDYLIRERETYADIIQKVKIPARLKK